MRMKNSPWVVLSGALLAGSLLGGCAPQPAPEEAAPADTAPPAEATAELQPTQGSQVTGRVTFQDNNGQVHVSAMISGLTPGRHGFHIHETGDCSAPDGTSAGGHFNPAGVNHGAPDADVHHVGDLGNLEADADGKAEYHANWGFLNLGEGPDSIVGKAVIVHAQEDDLTSQPTGAAGARLACGVIQRK